MIIRFYLCALLAMASIFAYGQNVDTSNVVIVLQNVDVRGHKPLVVERGDTLVYNVEALKMKDGAMLLDILKKLPGVQVKNGNVVVNGRNVSAIKINGKDFFRGNDKLALQNIPSSYVKEVKTYEEETKEARQTGIPENEKHEILDVILEDELENSFSVSGHSIGAQHRHYDQEWLLSNFSKKWSASLCGSMANIPKEDDFEESSGLNSNKNVGAMVQWSNKEGEEEPGLFSFYTDFSRDYRDNDVQYTLQGEQFLTSGQESHFSGGHASDRLKENNWQNNTTLYWYPNEKNSFQLAFTGDWGRKRSYGHQQMALCKSNPYQWEDMENPWENLLDSDPDARLRNILLNSEIMSTFQRTRSENYNVSALFTHKLDSLGSALSVKFEYNGQRLHEHQFSTSTIDYWNQGIAQVPNYYNQYVELPYHPYSWSGSVGFSHYFSSKLSLFTKYNISCSYSNEDRSWYALDSLEGLNPLYPPDLGWLPNVDSLAMVKVLRNSQYSTYRRNHHEVQLGISLSAGRWTIRPCVSMEFRNVHLNFHQSVLNKQQQNQKLFVSPTFFSEYKMSPHHWVRMNYYANTMAPDLLNLIDVADESNPLYVTSGNANLKEMWQHGLNMWYYHYNVKRQEAITFHPVFHQAFNSFSHKLDYDISTGKQMLKACNVQGNWDLAMGIEYNRTFGQEKRFNISASSTNSYHHNVGFSCLLGDLKSKNSLNAFVFDERIEANYMTDNLEVALTANLDCNYSRNSAASESNMNSCTTLMKGKFKYVFPWKTMVATEIGLRKHSGYKNSSLNGDEYLWNAQISQSFLKERNLLLGVRYYDILHQRKCISYERDVNSHYEMKMKTLGGLFLFTLQYNFSLMNKRKS